jgi:hypothetical protein
VEAARWTTRNGNSPPDTSWRANPRGQGLLGVTDAIAFFGSRGWPVSVPLIDSQPYDLIVDDAGTLHRVQVETTTCRSRSGAFTVTLSTSGGARMATYRVEGP